MYAVAEGTAEHIMTRFLEVPEYIYSSDPLYVPEQPSEVCRQLDVVRNPFFRSNEMKLFVCLRDAIPVARTSLVWPKGETKEPKRSSFGYFECINDGVAFQTLMDCVEATCADHNIRIVEGPFSPHHYGLTGFQIDGFGTRPAFLEPYSPHYYGGFFSGSGFRVLQTGHTWRRTQAVNPMPVEQRDEAGSSGYDLRVVRALSLSEFKDIALVIESAFRDNWGSVPISLDEYAYTAEGFAHALRSGLVAIVEHNRIPVGAIIMLLDLNAAVCETKSSGRVQASRHTELMGTRSLIVYAMGIVPEHRHTRAARVLASHFEQIAAQYETMTSTWITTGNRASEQLAKRFGFQPTKTFAVYEKRL